jgi:hypothetical protein
MWCGRLYVYGTDIKAYPPPPTTSGVSGVTCQGGGAVWFPGDGMSEKEGLIFVTVVFRLRPKMYLFLTKTWSDPLFSPV